jgi:hypothetical protein
MDLDLAQRMGILLYGIGAVAMCFTIHRQIYGKRASFLDAGPETQAAARRRARIVVTATFGAWLLAFPLQVVFFRPASVADLPLVFWASLGVVAAIGFGAVPPEAVPTLDERDFE